MKRLLIVLILFGSTAQLLRPLMTKLEAAMIHQEAALNPAGQVHEMFRDEQGRLWVSDYFADEIWQIDPQSGSYTVYENLTGASDGRLDSKGHLWWSDFDGSAVGRLLPGASQATLWTLPAGGNPLGIAFGASGQVWVTDVSEPILYRFAPASSQLCTYTLVNNGTADYLLYQADRVWLGDTNLGRILRLNPNNDTVSIWQLPPGAYPQGMDLDDSGNLWWADPGLEALARLDPNANQLTTFAIPAIEGKDAMPEAVAINDGNIWYTDQSGSIGMLDPLLASVDPAAISPSTAPMSPACSAVGSGTAVDVSERSGILNWVDADYPLILNNNGWLIYDLPSGAAPWDLTVSGNNVWFNDQGTADERAQQLGWLTFSDDPPPTVTPTATPTPPPEQESVIFLPIVIDF